MQKLLIFLIITFFSCYRAGHTSLIGEWKPIKVYNYNFFSKKKSVVYDVNNLEAVKKQLTEQYVSEMKTELENFENDSEAIKSTIDREFLEIDTVGFKNRLDSNYSKCKLANINFKNDSMVTIDSYGLIAPLDVPGLVFGDKFSCSWTQNSDKLKFTISNEKVFYSLFYKILKHTSDSLSLGLTTENYERPYLIIEFVKQ